MGKRIWLILLVLGWALPCWAQTPTLVNQASQESTTLSQGSTGNGNPTTGCWDTGTVGLNPYYFCLADASLSGNAIIAGCAYATTSGLGTPTLTDDKGQTYVNKVQEIDPGGYTVQIWYFLNTAAGAHQLKLAWAGTAPKGNMKCEAQQWANIAPSNADCGTAVGSTFGGSTVLAGSITPSQSGCLVYQLSGEDGGAQSTWAPGSGWTLQTADPRVGFASQTTIAGSGATACSMNMSTSSTGATACLALKPASQGSAGVTPAVRHFSTFMSSDGVNSYTYQFPCEGNHVAMAYSSNTFDAIPSSVTSTNPTATWTQVGHGEAGGEGNEAIWHSPDNFGCTSTTTVKVNFSSSSTTSGDVVFYDLAGMATSNALDTGVACSGGAAPLCTGSGNQDDYASPLTAVTITPSTSSGIMVGIGGISLNGGTSCNPTGYSDNQDNNDHYCHFIYNGASAETFSIATDERQGSGGVGDWSVAYATFKAQTGGGGTAASILATEGTPQGAEINTAFTTQLQAAVKDASNNAVSGVIVTFSAPSSGASGTFAGGVDTVTTDSNGLASAPVFTANGTVGGPYNVTATVNGVATSATFVLTNLAASSASVVTATAGTPQTATINATFATQFQATVKDAANNPVSGVTVTFTAPSSGASGVFAGGINTAATSSSGVATAPLFTANGIAGNYNVTATVAGVSAPANFSLTNTAGLAASIAANGGTPQSATINTSFATKLQATVKDAGNNPVSGATVTFTAPATGASGTFAGGVNRAVTNSSGTATASVFTANGTAGGPYNVTAAVTGVATPVTYVLTNLASTSPNVIAATAGAPQSTAINAAFATQLQATVKDAGSNPVSGVAVTFTAPSSGASGTFAGGVNTAATNSNGVATAPLFTANGTAGSYNVTATVAGVATPASFSLTNTSGPAASIAANGGTPQSATISTVFAAQFQATVKDAGSNPLSGVTVTFTAPSSGASGTFAGGTNTAITNSSGTATAPVFTANGTAGGPYNVTAAVTGVATPAAFVLTNLAGTAASAIAATAGTPQSATIDATFATQLQATVRDAGNNPVSGVTVAFTAPSSGASGTFAGGINTAATNSNGVATAPLFTANGTAGSYNVTAAVAGIAASANFSLTNTTGPAASVAASGGTPQSATVNSSFTSNLQATVKDAGNNPLSGVTVTFTAPGTGASGVFVGGGNAAITNANGVATSAVFNANGTAGTYTVTATVAGVNTAAPFALTNNNALPTITTLSPSSSAAGGPGFTLTVSGTGFAALAVVNFNGVAKTTTFVSASQVTAAITTVDIANGGTFPVTVTNPAPGGGTSVSANFNVNNSVVTVSGVTAGGQTHASGGAGLTLTVTGTNFVSNSAVNFGFGSSSKAEPTTFVSATQLIAAIPASDVATTGNAGVSVTNPGTGGSTSNVVSFGVDGFTVAGPSVTPAYTSGQQTAIVITISPTTNGFANAVSFSISGLPNQFTASFSPTSVTPNGNAATTTLTITATARGAMLPPAPTNRPMFQLVGPLLVLWLAALAGYLVLLLNGRALQLRRYVALVPIALVLVTVATLSGCAGLVDGASSARSRNARVKITASSGTISQNTNVTVPGL